jgi:hypothetical protein
MYISRFLVIESGGAFFFYLVTHLRDNDVIHIRFTDQGCGAITLLWSHHQDCYHPMNHFGTVLCLASLFCLSNSSLMD